MNQLEQKIIEKIREKGPVTFEEFMDMALYDPEFGYYTSQKSVIGREGDFYTSSHLHPLFGVMIGKQIEEMWELMGSPADFSIVEMGAGSGYVCRDMLDYFKGTDGKGKAVREERDIFRHLKYSIIERNPSVKGKQRDLLKDYTEKVNWCSDIKEKGTVIGCFFSNELLDAFPVHLLQMEEELREIYVAFDEGNLKEESGELSTDSIKEYFSEIPAEFEKGYRTEVNLRIKDWLDDINEKLAEGFVLAIDYGYPALDYYSEERNRGTLMCYHRHQFNENPYQNIGEQDITSHVNFSSVEKWGEELGLKTIGYCNQGTFLLSLRIDEEIKRLAESSKDYLFELSRIKKLFMPQGLGESHKAIIQYKGKGSHELKGFSIRNQLKSL